MGSSGITVLKCDRFLPKASGFFSGNSGQRYIRGQLKIMSLLMWMATLSLKGGQQRGPSLSNWVNWAE